MLANYPTKSSPYWIFFHHPKKMASETHTEGFPDRLAEIMGTQTNVAFGKRTGIDNSTIGKYAKGKSLPGMQNLVSLANATGYRLEWIATGKGPKRQRNRLQKQRDADFAGVPVVGEIEAGQLLQRYTTAHAEEHIQLDASALASTSDLLFGLRVQGRSMEQWMFEGDIALCSTIQPLHPGDDVCVYQFATGASTIKRLERIDKQKGRIDLRPVNPAFDSFSLNLKENDQVQKVIGVWRDYRLLKRHSDKL